MLLFKYKILPNLLCYIPANKMTDIKIIQNSPFKVLI